MIDTLKRWFNIDIYLQFGRYRRRCYFPSATHAFKVLKHLVCVHTIFRAQKQARRATVAQTVSPQKYTQFTPESPFLGHNSSF
jgi:hypothetical protein